MREEIGYVHSDTVLLEVDDLHTTLDTARGVVRAVDGVSFAIHRGEIFALLGESGCGKSLTALSLMRLLPKMGSITGGRVRFHGKDLLALPESAMRDVRGRQIGMIFQDPQSSLNPVMSVGAQVAEPLRHHLGLRNAALQTRLLELFSQVGIPDPEQRIGQYPHQFSGGMKQRVMIAMALACRPALLIADEPTTALDVTLQAQIVKGMQRLTQEAGMSLLIITHDIDVVREIADQVAVMYAGHLVEQAPRTAFFAKPLHPYTRKLFAALPNDAKRDQPLSVIAGAVPSLQQPFDGCRFAPRCEWAWDDCHHQVPLWLHVEDRSWVRCHLYDPLRVRPDGIDPGSFHAVVSTPPRQASITDTPLLEVLDLQVHFPLRAGWLQRKNGHMRAVDRVSFRLFAGRTMALVGESGCGKTTIGKAILQLTRPTAGQILLDGVDLSRLHGEALRLQRRKLQLVFQDPYASMNPRMRVGEIIGEGMQALGVIGNATARRDRIAQLIQQVGLSAETLQRYPHEFSGGQRQRIAIARALAVEPQLIVCDEPTSALDVSVQAQIINLLKELQNTLGVAYLFITHNLGLVKYLAHNVAVMYLGRVVEQGEVEEVLKTPKHPYTRLLLGYGEQDNGIDPPNPTTLSLGCSFQRRCPNAMPLCREQYPCAAVFSDTHFAHCHLYK